MTAYNSGIVLFNNKDCFECEDIRDNRNSNRPVPIYHTAYDENGCIELCCEKCYYMKEDGGDFLFTHYGNDIPYSKIELQLQYFQKIHLITYLAMVVKRARELKTFKQI